MSNAPSPPVNRSWWWESALLVLLCYLKAGWPPPDVNEAHYLCKAKHYWDPAWCGGDFFLASADAHAPFYFVFGWVTLLVSLPAAAWIGRFATWILLALAWQRLSWSLTPVRFAAVVSGGLMIVLTTAGHMAGEWIIGGVEAKGFAFALVLVGMEQLVRGRWNWVFALCGGAAALHVLVGGWSVVAAGVAWLLSGKDRPPLVKLVPGLAIGFLLSLLGLVPGILLNSGVDAETAAEANQIYVFERLAHHLVFVEFPPSWIARHVALIVLFAIIAWDLRQKVEPGSERAAGLRRLQGFIGGAVAIALVGIAVDLATLYHGELAARLLRFYWFRLTDVMAPIGVALFATVVWTEWRATHPRAAAWLFVGLWLGVCGPILIWNYQRQQQRLSGAALQAWQQSDAATSLADAQHINADWIAVCRWIRANTPEDAIFLTPKEQQTFKWHAHRAEVVCLKDIPQDARGIVEWQRRKKEVFAWPANVHGLAAMKDEQLIALAKQYGASYLIIDKFPRIPPWQRVYPLGGEVNETYAVYRLPVD